MKAVPMIRRHDTCACRCGGHVRGRRIVPRIRARSPGSRCSASRSPTAPKPRGSSTLSPVVAGSGTVRKGRPGMMNTSSPFWHA